MLHNCDVKRLLAGTVLPASVLLAPFAYAQANSAPIGNPYTDTLQLWSEIVAGAEYVAQDLPRPRKASHPTCNILRPPSRRASRSLSHNLRLNP